jgi:transcriptional regulator with XRE-family HTH domain
MAANYNKSIDPESLGTQLRSARLEANLTLQEVGSGINISHSQISRIERGDFRGPSKNVQILCEYFNIDWRGAPSARDKATLASRLDRAANASPQWATVIVAFVEAIETAQNFKT